MQRNAFALSAAICAVLMTATMSNAAVYLLNVQPAQSSASVDIDLFTPVGNGSDSDTSPLSGYVLIETGTAAAPFGTARVLDLSLTNTQAVEFSICVVEFIGCLAAAEVDAGPGDIQVDLITPGAVATVTAGSFTQTNNEVAVTGMVFVDGTGLADGQIPEGMFLLDGMTVGDFGGDLSESMGVLQLTVQINATISETDMELGVTTETTVDSTVVASGTQVEPGDMNCSGNIDIDDVPLLVQALLNEAAFNGCSLDLADVNEDGSRDGLDVVAFVGGF